MYVKEAVSNIANKRLDEMKQNINAALSEKAVHKLEERKIEIAKNYFATLSESKSPADEGKEAAEKDDNAREKHMEKYGKSPKRLTGELAAKFMKKKSKG